MTAESDSQTSYRPEFCRTAKEIYKLGGSESNVAAALGVTEKDLKAWSKQYDDFRSACREGKRLAADAVVHALVKRCTGYHYEAEKVVVVNDEPMRVPYRAYMPPDTAAIKFFLTNRDSGCWSRLGDPKGDAEGDSPFALFYQQIAGKVLRPNDPDRPQREKAVSSAGDHPV